VQNVKSVKFVLAWTDEPDGTGCPPPAARWVNQPDNFGLKVSGPDGESKNVEPIPNVHGQPGSVEITIEVNHTEPNDGKGVGRWNYTIVCGDCGNEVKRRPGVLGYNDNGNDWTIAITYTFYEETKK
jgi:hypothetical protein